MSETCLHCERTIVPFDGGWIDPEASGDDEVWRETCDAHDTFIADHEPCTADEQYDWEDDDSDDDEPQPGTDEYARKYPLREDVRQAELWGGTE